MSLDWSQTRRAVRSGSRGLFQEGSRAEWAACLDSCQEGSPAEWAACPGSCQEESPAECPAGLQESPGSTAPRLDWRQRCSRREQRLQLA